MHAAHLAVLGTQTASSQPAAPSLRLAKAAHEFEGQMMKELLQPMMESDGLGDDDDDSSGLDSGDGLGSGMGSGGALAEFASESLGQALSERGGFGIANRIIQELGRNGNHKLTNKVTRDLHGDTVMRKLK